MTGEISLVGQVLPVGGLKEKILAAHRAGIKTIIAPEANRPDAIRRDFSRLPSSTCLVAASYLRVSMSKHQECLCEVA